MYCILILAFRSLNVGIRFVQTPNPKKHALPEERLGKYKTHNVWGQSYRVSIKPKISSKRGKRQIVKKKKLVPCKPLIKNIYLDASHEFGTRNLGLVTRYPHSNYGNYPSVVPGYQF